MLPTNVMSFMKKMVATSEVSDSASQSADTSTTLSKLRQTLSSSLMSAQETVTKLSPTRQPLTPESAAAVAALALNANIPNASKKEENKTQPKNEPVPGRPRSGACRVCLKSFKTDDFFRVCFECQQKVCEDCASYSKNEDGQDESKWRCSICRRRSQSRAQTQRTASASGALGLRNIDNSDLLDIPGSLQRRHSDVKLGGNNNGNAKQTQQTTNMTGLDIPRSPELRRHSDVSPASLKELEKVAGERREELRWEREMEWRAEQSDRMKQRRGGSLIPTAAGAKFIIGGDEGKSSESSLDDDTMTEEEAEWRRQQVQRAAMQSQNQNQNQSGVRSPRRRSRVMHRQHSYDEEETGGHLNTAMFELPRRASAYDVYQTAGMAKIVDGQADLSGRRPSFRSVPKPLNGSDETSGSGHEGSPLSPEKGGRDDWTCLNIEEDRRGRRRSSAIEGNRSLPYTPAMSDRRVSVAPPRQDDNDGVGVKRQQSVAGEDIKIVIHDVDSENVILRPGIKRRVVLRRDPGDKTHRTRGFGLRVVGGKTGSDGRLFAYIVWTVPQGPAHQAGLVQGDRVIEWNNISLTDKSFEEVSAIMDRTGETAELLIEHFTDLRLSDILDDVGLAQAAAVAGPRKSIGEAIGLPIDSDNDKGPASPTRRKLPKTPEQIVREKTVSGRIQLQAWYLDERKELVVSVLAADDLAPREDTGYGSQPEAYVRIQLSNAIEPRTLKTDVAEPSHNPIWNATFEIDNIPPDEIMKQHLEISLWDYCPDRDSQFLGECTVELKKAFMEDRPGWYRLEDPRQLRMKSPHVSPRGSLANTGTAAREIAQRLLRRGDFQQQRSYSDDKEDDKGGAVSHSSSVESGLLHPDHAYLGQGSRRGSSQSEIIEADTYQLGRDFSRSLPGSRRASFQNTATNEKEELIPVNYNRERRRSSSARGTTHYEQMGREELLRNLKGESSTSRGELSRTFSLSQDKRPARRPSRYAHDILTGAAAALSRLDSKQKTQKNKRKSVDHSIHASDDSGKVNLGPGQVPPRGFKFLHQAEGYGEVRLSLLMTKGQLEVDVLCARGLAKLTKHDTAPDTYVKTYLKDGEKWLQKRKTRVFRMSFEPLFKQTLRYSACDVLGRGLVVMLWAKQKGFESNLGLGGAELALDKLQLTQATVAWYPLFPMNTLSGADDSNLDSP